MKKVHVPPMLAALVQNGVMAVEGKHFSGAVPCPSCGGEVSGYDERERRFATIIDGDRTRDVSVTVTRFRCRQCREICSARAPFYPDTRLGSPIVDLCVTGAKELPCSQVAGILREFGLVVDRGTVRNYAGRDFGFIPVTELFGLRIPQSVLSLSMYAVRTDGLS